MEPYLERSDVLCFCAVHKVRDEEELSWHHQHFGRNEPDELYLIQRKDSNNGHKASSGGKRVDSNPKPFVNEQDLTMIVLQNKIKMERICDEICALRRDLDCKMNALRAEMMDRLNVLITSPRPPFSWNVNGNQPQTPLLCVTPSVSPQSLPNHPVPSFPQMVSPESFTLLQQILPMTTKPIH